MKYIFYLLFFVSFCFAHKVNLFTTIKDDKIEIYSYFSNSSPCKNCKLIIKNDDKIVFEDKLNEEGKYLYKSSYENIEIIIDASSGHVAKEKIQLSNIKKEDLKTHLKKEENNKYINILLGLFLIGLIFFVLKKIKK